MATTLADIAAILNTTEKNAPARIIGMKIGPVCGRCGGSGRYSFNQIDGDRCYGCNGTGYRAPGKREMNATLARAKEAVAVGELDAYLQQLADRKACAAGSKAVFAAWMATNAAQNNPHHCKRDEELTAYELSARRANALMAKAHSEWAKIEFDREMDPTAKAAVLHNVLARIEAVDIPAPK